MGLQLPSFPILVGQWLNKTDSVFEDFSLFFPSILLDWRNVLQAFAKYLTDISSGIPLPPTHCLETQIFKNLSNVNCMS